MAKNTDSSIKLLVLYDILSKMTDEEHALSTNEIIAELEKRNIPVSRKVLPSDIALLNKYGYEVSSYVKRARYYYVAQHTFDKAEIVMLSDVIKSSKLTEQKQASLIEKLYSTIGAHRNPHSSHNLIALKDIGYGNSSLIYNIDAIEQAIEQKKKVSFLYFKLDENKKRVYNSDKKRYVFNPLCMLWNRDNYYLLCYDDRHDGLSRYRIDKMEDVRVEKKPRFEKQEFEDFNVDEYRKQVVSMFGGELQNVEIQFHKDLLNDIYDKYGIEMKIEKLSDNEFKTTLDIEVSRTFFIWVVGSMGKVKITAPETVKQQFDEFINAIKENY